MNRLALLLSFFIAFCAFTPVASALNISFLKNSVLSRFSRTEMTDFRANVSQALSNANDGSVLAWESDSGKFSARVLFRATYINNGDLTCRRVLFKISEGDMMPERYRFDLCNNQDQWRFSQTSVSSFTSDEWSYLKNIATETLNNEPDAVSVSWFYRKTGNAGVITPLTTEETDGKKCREATFSIISRSGDTFDGNYTFCKRVGEDWFLSDRQ